MTARREETEAAFPPSEGRWTLLSAEAVAAANTRRAPEESARAGAARWQKLAGLALLGGIGWGLVVAPGPTGAGVLAALALLIGATALLRVAVLIAARPWPRRGAAPVFGAEAPRLGIIVALRGEDAILPVLLGALMRLEYPRERLRVALAIEDDDAQTKAALERLFGADAERAPAWLEIVEAPGPGPRTKPRALNAAWAHLAATGPAPEIVGVFDAEDRPEPEMLVRAVAALQAAPDRVAVVQARLGYYNARDGWIARCFAIEYAAWFDVTMNGLAALGAPPPLGGSSVFFRAAALKAVGGWDAHNVTEDADLGMRLAEAGWGFRLVDATTHEEAASRPGAWVRQRSRWLKGYMQTWIRVSRRPARTAARMGLGRYLVAQVLLLGGPVTALAQPLVILALVDALHRWALGLSEASAGAGGAGVGDVLSGAFDALASGVAWYWVSDWVGALGPLAPALLALLLIRQLALLVGALIGLGRTRQLGLAPWCLTLPLYWPLSALAACKALLELFFAPFYWDKTRHGVGRVARRMSQTALAEWRGAGSPPSGGG